MKFTATALLLALLNGGAQSWRVAPGAPVRDRVTARSAVVGDERGLDRRAAIAAGLSTTAAATLALQPRASLAANAAGGPVGEGGLPPGAAEFERVVRGQRNWENVGKRLSKASASDITTKDWDECVAGGAESPRSRGGVDGSHITCASALSSLSLSLSLSPAVMGSSCARCTTWAMTCRSSPRISRRPRASRRRS